MNWMLNFSTTVWMMTYELRTTATPITAPFKTDFALLSRPGLAPANMYMMPPATNESGAMTQMTQAPAPIRHVDLPPTSSLRNAVPYSRPPSYHPWYTAIMPDKPEKRVPAIFFRMEGGGEPVRDWLKLALLAEDRRRVGHDIMTVEYSWPLGMPTCRHLESRVHEVRTDLSRNRIARVLFYIEKFGRMVLLPGFIKKTRRTPAQDLNLARGNKKKHERGLP
jgi:phage-related protein